MASSISRRKLLTAAAQISMGAALVSTAGAAENVCVDLKKMSADEVTSRNSLHWTAMSAHPDKSCSICNFFTATSGGCGMCLILGGPTYATGYCDSWTAKGS